MGRSRNDEVATCIRLKLREDLLKQMAALLKVREVLIAIAEQHRESVMPGFTHMQHAQPTTLAHHLLAYEQQFSRDFDRLRDAYARVNLCPLGAAAFASTGYPIDREYTAKILAFDGLVANTMDAVATRDFALETLADLSILMANVSRLCEELVIWSTSFVKFVTLDDAFCSTSSIMPQKKNPDTAEIMRAKTGSVFGAYTGALMTVKGLPMSYNRDLQELTPNIWRGMQDAKESLRLLIDMLSSATFETERMKEEAGRETLPQPSLPIRLSGTTACPSAPPTTSWAVQSRRGAFPWRPSKPPQRSSNSGSRLKVRGSRRTRSTKRLTWCIRSRSAKRPEVRRRLRQRSRLPIGRNCSIPIRRSSTNVSQRLPRQKKISSPMPGGW